MSIRTAFLPLTVAAMLALATAAAWAQDGGRGGRQDRGGGGERDRSSGMRGEAGMAPMIVAPRPEPRANRGRREDALADSVRRIERSTRGQVISAERMQSDGRDINRIKVMDDRGRVRVYMDDPQQRRQPPTRDDDN
jgi:hypothetical protein